MVQDLFVSNFLPKLLRFRSTSSYGFSFSVEKTCSCLNKMTVKPQANVWRESLTLTKGMNRGQQRVPGAQLGLDIAAQERSESKRSRSAGWSDFFFSFPQLLSALSPQPIWNSWTQHDWWVTVQACSTACCEKRGGDSPSQDKILVIEILSFTWRLLWPFSQTECKNLSHEVNKI